MTPYWPGTDIRKSIHNAFSLHKDGTPYPTTRLI